MTGTPLKNLFPNGLCQAKNRRGEPCGVRLDVRRCKNGRLLCKWHGGYSTGPRTPEGKARCGEAGRRNLRQWHARRGGQLDDSAADGAADSENTCPESQQRRGG